MLQRGTASFSLQKQLPPRALLPPCHWPDAGGGVVAGGAAGSAVSGLQHRSQGRQAHSGAESSVIARRPALRAGTRALAEGCPPGPCRNRRGTRKDHTEQGAASCWHCRVPPPWGAERAGPAPLPILLSSPRKLTGVPGKAGAPEPNRCVPTRPPALLLSLLFSTKPRNKHTNKVKEHSWTSKKKQAP